MNDVYPPGSLVEFTGVCEEKGEFEPGIALYVTGVQCGCDVSLIMYLKKAPTGLVIAVGNSEISLADEQEPGYLENRKLLINRDILPALRQEAKLHYH